MHGANIGRFLTQVACEVGKSAVTQWVHGAQTAQRTEAVTQWARQHSGTIAAFSAKVAAQLLAKIGLHECTEDQFLAATAKVYDGICEGMRFTVEETLEVPGVDAHMRDELLHNEDVGMEFLRAASGMREDLLSGRIPLESDDD